MPSSRRGCAETLDDPYDRRVPLPRITGYRQLDKQAQPANVTDDKASHTWHTHLLNYARLIPNTTGPTNYYAQLRIFHNPYR